MANEYLYSRMGYNPLLDNPLYNGRPRYGSVGKPWTANDYVRTRNYEPSDFYDMRELTGNQPEVSLNGKSFSRMYTPEELIGAYRQFGIPLPAGGITGEYNDQYGSLVDNALVEPINERMRALSAADDKSSTMHFLAGAAMFGGLPLGTAGAFGSGVQNFLGGASGLTNAASTGLEGFTGGSLPDSYWSMLAEGGGLASDAAPAAAGTMGDLSAYEGLGYSAEDLAALPNGTYAGAEQTAAQSAEQLGGLSGLTTMGGSGQAALDAARAAAEKAGPAATTALGRLVRGEANADDYLRLGGILGSSLLGYLGSEAQAGALSGTADKYLALGAPYRGKLAESYAPGFDLAKSDPQFQNALDTSSDTVLRRLSATAGNPFDNPGAMTEAMRYVTGNVYLPQLNTYRSQLGGFGQLGINTAGTADLAGAQNAGGAYDALGYGLGQLTQPQDTLESLMKKLNFTIGTGKTFSG